MKFAVVGAGICGLSAARVLAERGHAIDLFERHPLFHSFGSSHGASRIVRKAYPDAFYTACMAEAYPLWHDLELASGQKLLHECGLLYFGRQDAENIVSVSRSLSELSVPHQVLGGQDARQRFPRLQLQPDEAGIWTAEAGWVDAARAMQCTYDLAVSRGAQVKIQTTVNPLELARNYDAVLVAAGHWIREFIDLPVKATVQTFAYIDAEVDGPVWIEDSADNPYGFPSDERGFKIGIHRAGPSLELSDPRREPSEEMLGLIRNTAEQRFGISTPQVRSSHACIYTTTANEDFLAGRLAPNVFFMSACSGHGFKMGPWTGRMLANFGDGSDAPENHPRFYFRTPAAS